ncbi:uncharacterized protein LOC123971082 isoform X2 [Micropterus dolomieu]|uniref:uncharacterized protein LOC123971082 isoform X2 n=1 Tax=Micropterus dolomieu TaxID=147949 RepID=UPI001E8D485B|nr:uncharacterized protein LOC123971082 isoform X2 [Micropterus dolomieu]
MTVHTGEKQYSCSVCDSVFTGPLHLKNHPCVGRRSLQLHQSLTKQMDTEADGKDCGGPEPVRNTYSDRHLQPDSHDKTSHFSEPETDLEESREPQSGSSPLHNNIECNTGEKPFSCTECGKLFLRNTDLKRHMNTHTGNKTFSCSVCSKNFSHSESLTQHMSLHVEENGYICSVCGKTLTSWPQLVNHRCVQRFSSLQRLTKQKNAGAKGEDCGGPQLARNSDTVGRVQPDIHDQTSHTEPETDNTDNTLQNRKVPGCDRECNTGKTATSSSECATSSGPKETQTRGKPFSWSVCSTELCQKESLTLPMVEKRYWCKVCGESFTLSKIKYHQCVGRQSSHLHQSQTEENRDVELLKTEVDGEDCGGPEPVRNLNPDGHLQPDTHDKTSHTEPETDNTGDWEEASEPQSGSNPLQDSEVPGNDQDCRTGKTSRSSSKCASSSGHKRHLQEHNYTVAGDGPFSCSVCSKNFNQRESLTQHMLLHVGEKRYWCSVCDESFTWSILKYHQCAGRQSSHLHQSQTEQNRDAELVKTEADGEDCGVPGPFRNSDTEGHLQPATDDKTSHLSELGTDLNETSEPQSGLNHVQNNEIPGSGQECNTDKTSTRSSECASSSDHKRHLQEHNYTLTGDGPFSCSVCSKNLSGRESLTQHMSLHVGEKRYWCSVCDESFTWSILKYHQCAGRQSSHLHQSQTEQNRDAELVKTEADGEDCGVPGPFRNSDTEGHLQPATDDKTSHLSELGTDLNETSEPQSGLNHVQNNEIPGSGQECNTDKTSTRFSECASSSDHKETQTAKKQFSSVFRTKFAQRKSLTLPMIGKQYSCSVCDKSFTWWSQLKNHQCVGPQSSRLHQRLTEQMETEADVEDCGGPELARNSDPDRDLELNADDKTENSSHTETDRNCDWEETREPPSGSNPLPREVPVRDVECKTRKTSRSSTWATSSSLKGRLQKHNGLQKDEKPFSCSVCGKRYTLKSSLTRHMILHSEEKGFSCSVCKNTFLCREDVVRHKKIHTRKKKQYSCSVCGKRFTRPSQLKNHQCVGRQSSQVHQGQIEENRDVQLLKTKADGEDCGGPEPARNSHPDRHLQPDTDDKTENSSDPETDDSCDWEETRESQSGSNSLQKHEVPGRDQECSTGTTSRSTSECAANSGHKGRLQKHNGCQKGEKPFSCSVCGKRYTLKSSLTRHMILHSEEKGFSCSVCKNTFLCREDVVRHKKIHTRKKKQYSCSVCGKRFTRPSQLKNHQCVGRQSSQVHQGQIEENRDVQLLKTKADGEDCGGPEPARNSHPDRHLQPDTDDKTENSSDPETDDSCDWEETRESQSGSNSLQKHEVPGRDQECSTGTTSRSTSECAANSGHKGRLQKHNGCQKGEKPFSCSVCGKRYTLKSSLTRHMILHSEEKGFSCSVCKNTFLCREDVVRHKKIHKRKKKQYSCSVCGKRFTRPSQLKNHQCVGRQSTQVHQRQIKDNRDAELVKTKADGEVCGGPEPARNSDPDRPSHSAADDKMLPASEPRTSWEGETLRGLEEADIIKFPFSPVSVKSEEDDEEKPQSPQLHQRLTEQMETETDGEDCGGPEPARNSDPDRPSHSAADDKTENSSDPETDDSCDWEETREPQSGSNSLQKHEVPGRDQECSTGTTSRSTSECAANSGHKGRLQKHNGCQKGEKPFSCSVCGKRYTLKSSLTRHMILHSEEKVFSCSVCKNTFLCREEFKKHMKIHKRKKKQYSCSVCGKRFSRRSQFKKHQCVGRQSSQVHQGQTEETRDEELVKTEAGGEVCGGLEPARNSDTDLKPSTNDKTSPFSGPRTDLEENREPQSGSNPVQNNTQCNTGKKPFSCAECGKLFRKKSKMKTHMKNHTRDELFSCSVCSKVFNRRIHLKEHKATHTKDYNCSVCGKRFTRRSKFIKHQCVDRQSSQLHQGLPEENRDEELVKAEAGGEDCGGLEPARNSDTDLQSSTNDKTSPFSGPRTDLEETREPQSGSNPVQNNTQCNTGKKPFSCAECGKLFCKKSKMKTHMKNHTRDELFSCSVCSKVFNRRIHLKEHKATHTKDYNCSVCGKRFTRRSKFIKHQCVDRQSSQLHQGLPEENRDEELVKAEAGGEDCGGLEPARNSDTDLQSSTNDKTSPFSGPRTDLEETREPQSGSNPVQNNTQCNTGKKPFSCAECGKLFCKKSKMKTHMKNHTRDELFSCSVCSKVFNRRIHLKEHKATHTKDYNCSVCGKRFTRRSKFIKHQCVDRQSSQLHQGLPEENRDEELVQAEAGGEDCGGLEPARNLNKEGHLQPATDDKTSQFSEPKADLEETREPQSGSNPLQSNEVPLQEHIGLQTPELPHIKEKSSPSMDQEDPPERPLIKEEQDELWTSQEGKQLQEHQRLTEHMETKTDGEGCGGPEPARNSDPDGHFQPEVDDKMSHSEPKTDDSCDWEETREPQSGSKPSQNNEVPVSDQECSTVKTSSSSSECATSSGHKPNEVPVSDQECSTVKTSSSSSECATSSGHKPNDVPVSDQECTTVKTSSSSSECATSSGHKPNDVPVSDQECTTVKTSSSSSECATSSGHKPNDVPVSDQECTTVKTSSSSSECATSSGHKPNDVPVSDQECTTVKTSSSSSECATSSGHKPNDVPVSDQECTTVKTSSSSSECATSSGHKPNDVPVSDQECTTVKTSSSSSECATSSGHKPNDVPVSDQECSTVKTPSSSSECATSSGHKPNDVPVSDQECSTVKTPSSSSECATSSGHKPNDVPVSDQECSTVKTPSSSSECATSSGHKPNDVPVSDQECSTVKTPSSSSECATSSGHKPNDVPVSDQECSTVKTPSSSSECATSSGHKPNDVPVSDQECSTVKTPSSSSECATSSGHKPNDVPVSDQECSTVKTPSSSSECATSSGHKPNDVPVSDQECSTVKTPSSSSECATSSGHKPNDVPVSDQECSTVKTPSSSSECATSSGHKPNDVPVSDQECSTVKTPSSSSECATSSGRKGRLQKQNKVQQEMPFTCSVCGKGYLGKNSLTGHMRIHREVKDFSCSDCDKKFHSRNSLSKHKKNDHAGEMPFTCYICGKRFVLQKQLSRHMNVGLHLTVLS